MRIVSLLPSATEIVCALGLAESLVGITHECDYPAALIAGKPVVTGTLIPHAHPPAEGDDEGEPLSAGEIDEMVRAALEAGKSLYHIDTDLLRSLQPDLVLTQGLCDVCAVNHAATAAAVALLDKSVTVLDLAPTTLAGVMASFAQVGEVTGKTAEAAELVAQTQARWDAVRHRTESKYSPRTLLLEWPDPLFTAGHWNPELLTLAGGTAAPWDEVGVPSRTLSWDEIAAFDPEMIVLIACGFDAYRALDEAWPLTDYPGWYDLTAVREGDCYAIDGNAYFNRPGPRLAESAEILATIFYPEEFQEMLPPYSVQRFPNALLVPPKEEKEETAP